MSGRHQRRAGVEVLPSVAPDAVGTPHVARAELAQDPERALVHAGAVGVDRDEAAGLGLDGVLDRGFRVVRTFIDGQEAYRNGGVA